MATESQPPPPSHQRPAPNAPGVFTWYGPIPRFAFAGLSAVVHGLLLAWALTGPGWGVGLNRPSAPTLRAVELVRVTLQLIPAGSVKQRPHEGLAASDESSSTSPQILAPESQPLSHDTSENGSGLNAHSAPSLKLTWPDAELPPGHSGRVQVWLVWTADGRLGEIRQGHAPDLPSVFADVASSAWPQEDAMAATEGRRAACAQVRYNTESQQVELAQWAAYSQATPSLRDACLRRWR